MYYVEELEDLDSENIIIDSSAVLIDSSGLAPEFSSGEEVTPQVLVLADDSLESKLDTLNTLALCIICILLFGFIRTVLLAVKGRFFG